MRKVGFAMENKNLSCPNKEEPPSFLEELFSAPEKHTYGKILLDLLDNLNDCIIVADKYGKIVYVNPAFSKSCGLPPERQIGKFVRELEPNAKILEVIETGEGHFDRLDHIDSFGVDIIATSFPFYIKGVLEGAVGIWRIVTDFVELNQKMERLLMIKQSEDELKQNNPLPEPFSHIVGENSLFKRVLTVAALASKSDVPVLIQGESGVGKEVLARAIHMSSPRANGPFIKINCAAIPDQLFESELFGYDEGAFTGAKRGGKKGKIELAEGGTLLLDEIGEMSLQMQAKLLRVLQEKEIDRLGGKGSIKINVRFIALTNRDLKAMVAKMEFREDLFYRINLMTLEIPPLRNRRDDIKHYVDYYLDILKKRYNRNLICSREVIKIFFEYSWPGNIRELQNVLEHASIICSNDLILPDNLPTYLNTYIPATFFQEVTDMNLKNLIKDMEEKVIRSAMKATNNNKTKAMKILGISRRAFYQKLALYKIQ